MILPMYEVCMYVDTTQNIFGLVVTIEHLRGEIFALSHASINSFPHTLKYTYIGVEMQKNIMVKGHVFRKLWVVGERSQFFHIGRYR